MNNQLVKINIASPNPVKIAAVKETILDYDFLKKAEIKSVIVDSGVSDQPKSLEETIQGAINRAKNAWPNCHYSFGLESGMMAVPNTKTGFMDVCVCVIFDGEEIYLGLSSAWETPEPVFKEMFENGLDMNEAAYKSGLTKNAKVGSAEGLVGLVTRNRLNRKEYTKQSIVTALIRLEAKQAL